MESIPGPQPEIDHRLHGGGACGGAARRQPALPLELGSAARTPPKMSEKERVEMAVREATASLREIAEKHG